MSSDESLPSPPRIAATVLALGGIYWGVLLLRAFGWGALEPVPFGVGYVVALGYVVRAVACPPLVVRHGIWALSILVQSGWLLSAVLIPGIKSHVVVWWAFATFASVVAVVAEEEDAPRAEPAPCPSSPG